MFTSFSKETWQAFKEADRAGPIHMLNLVKLREKAEYADGHEATGAEAYQRYGEISAPVLQKLGGKIVWRGGFELMMVGPQDVTWDIAFIAEYPGVGAFVEMMRDATYREAMVHRQAGVLDSRLVRFNAQSPGAGFAG
ncbi:DUF1330 domain-containing protein [Anderseniella sp. Alg231-50]|uniref:DUF1330 domain-containing protein n=1 Tax=Anderseniella sp. Alg231-50 TaxID=1922226 RepID=UPI000D55E323